jgi:hypothetical protein
MMPLIWRTCFVPISHGTVNAPGRGFNVTLTASIATDKSAACVLTARAKGREGKGRDGKGREGKGRTKLRNGRNEERDTE